MKVVFYDVESFPITAHCWGTFRQFIAPNQIVMPGRVACWAAKELGKPKIHFSAETEGHEKMVTKLHTILSDATAVVTYNGVGFDNKMMATEYIKYGLAPLPPAKQLDLYRVVKKNFRFPSNKLEYVSQALGIGQKVKHSGFDLWTRCMAGEKKAWAEMKEYNSRDTELLESLYNKLLPYISNHPSHSLETESLVCTNCGSGKLQSRGYETTKVGKYRRFQCSSCGKWQKSKLNEVPHGTELMVSL